MLGPSTLSPPVPSFLLLSLYALPPKSHLSCCGLVLLPAVAFLASVLYLLAFQFTSSIGQPELALKTATTSCCSPDILSHPLIYFPRDTYESINIFLI